MGPDRGSMWDIKTNAYSSKYSPPPQRSNGWPLKKNYFGDYGATLGTASV